MEHEIPSSNIIFKVGDRIRIKPSKYSHEEYWGRVGKIIEIPPGKRSEFTILRVAEWEGEKPIPGPYFPIYQLEAELVAPKEIVAAKPEWKPLDPARARVGLKVRIHKPDKIYGNFYSWAGGLKDMDQFDGKVLAIKNLVDKPPGVCLVDCRMGTYNWCFEYNWLEEVVEEEMIHKFKVGERVFVRKGWEEQWNYQLDDREICSHPVWLQFLDPASEFSDGDLVEITRGGPYKGKLAVIRCHSGVWNDLELLTGEQPPPMKDKDLAKPRFMCSERLGLHQVRVEDRVYVNKGKSEHGCCWTSGMDKFVGKVFEVTELSESGNIPLRYKSKKWYFHPSWLSPIKSNLVVKDSDDIQPRRIVVENAGEQSLETSSGTPEEITQWEKEFVASKADDSTTCERCGTQNQSVRYCFGPKAVLCPVCIRLALQQIQDEIDGEAASKKLAEAREKSAARRKKLRRVLTVGVFALNVAAIQQVYSHWHMINSLIWGTVSRLSGQ